VTGRFTSVSTATGSAITGDLTGTATVISVVGDCLTTPIIVATARHTNTFLAERYRRPAKHRSKKRAIIAVGNSVLTIVWPLLSDPEGRYHDLGPDFHQSRINPRRKQRDLVRQLERLTGQTVTFTPRHEQIAA
jgi:hypothetical protein